MASAALEKWQSTRGARLDQLFGLCAQAPEGIDQFTPFLAVMLSAEWQGFARDLHDEAVDAFVTRVAAAGSREGADHLRWLLTEGRRLGRGDADERALIDDFGRLGLELLWARLEAEQPYGGAWRGHLRRLMKARNGVVHDDQIKLLELHDEGYPLDVRTAQRWREALDGLVAGLDGVVADSLADHFDSERPW